MSFRGVWRNIQERTYSFNEGAGDSRTTPEVMHDMDRSIREALEALASGNPESRSIPGYTECEERLAAVLTDMMYIAEREQWDIPDAMAKRNTKIRVNWRSKNLS